MQFGTVTLDARHILVDLDNEAFGGAGNLRRIIVAGTEAEIAVPIHRRYRVNKGINANIVDQQPGGLVKVVGHIVDDLTPTVLHPALDKCAFGSGDKHAIGNTPVIELIT